MIRVGLIGAGANTRDRHIPGLADSKVVPPDERDDLYEEIVRHALAWTVACT